MSWLSRLTHHCSYPLARKENINDCFFSPIPMTLGCILSIRQSVSLANHFSHLFFLMLADALLIFGILLYNDFRSSFVLVCWFFAELHSLDLENSCNKSVFHTFCHACRCLIDIGYIASYRSNLNCVLVHCFFTMLWQIGRASCRERV